MKRFKNIVDSETDGVSGKARQGERAYVAWFLIPT